MDNYFKIIPDTPSYLEHWLCHPEKQIGSYKSIYGVKMVENHGTCTDLTEQKENIENDFLFIML